MIIIEIIAVLLVIGGAYRGWRKGLICQAGQVAGVVSAIVVCRALGRQVLDVFVDNDADGGDAMLVKALVYCLLFVVVYLGVSVIAKSIKIAIHSLKLGVIDRLAGVCFTVFEWLFVFSLLLNLWIAAVPSTKIETDNRPLRPILLELAPKVLAATDNFGMNQGDDTGVNDVENK